MVKINQDYFQAILSIFVFLGMLSSPPPKLNMGHHQKIVFFLNGLKMILAKFQSNHFANYTSTPSM